MDETGAKITALDPLTDGASDDLLAIVDVSDNNVEEGAMSADGTDKKITLENLAHSLLDWIYPVGTIYETTSTDLDTTTKMATHFGGTWEAYGSGRVLVGKADSGTFATAGATMGEETHTLTVAEMPSHSHAIKSQSGNYPTTDFTDAGFVRSRTSNYELNNTTNIANAGSGQAHNNIQPSIVVYRYRRTA